MARIEIVNDGTVRECAEGANLLAELLRASAFVDNPCNGTGVCGKCKVRIVDGEVSKVSATEQKLLSREELAQGIRLACMTCVSGDTIAATSKIAAPPNSIYNAFSGTQFP